MLIKVERVNLLEAVSNLSRAVLTRAAIPVLEGILFSAEGSAVTMMAYNLEIGMTKVLPVRVEEDGDIVLNAKILFEILRKMDGDIVEINVDEKMMAHISCGASNFDIVGMTSEDFPEMPTVSENEEVTVSSEVLKDMVRQTAFAAATSENARPILMGIKFEFSGNKMSLIAIDGSRLAIRNNIIETTNDAEFIVSSRAINEAVKTIGEEDEKITIRVGKKHISFENNGYIIISRLIDGEYIDYKRSIPLSETVSIKVNVKEILNTIDRISLIINDQIKTPIRMKFEKGKIIFTSVSSIGRATDEMAVDYDGNEFTIGFNSRYLTEALKATECEEIYLKFNGSAAAAVISPVETNDFLYLVMPMRLSW